VVTKEIDLSVRTVADLLAAMARNGVPLVAEIGGNDDGSVSLFWLEE
jgi:hypothetical protein